MSKSIKIFSIILIIFSLFISFYGVYATTDINMNLESGETSENEIIEDNNFETDDITDTGIQTSNPTTQDTYIPPTGVSSVVEEGLTLSNILSILLIAVGVVLILLAIAIIIRLK